MDHQNLSSHLPLRAVIKSSTEPVFMASLGPMDSRRDGSFPGHELFHESADWANTSLEAATCLTQHIHSQSPLRLGEKKKKSHIKTNYKLNETFN